MGVEDDDSDLAVAQDAQLISFLHQPELALGESHLSVPFVRNPLDRNLFPSHLVFFKLPSSKSVNLLIWGCSSGCCLYHYGEASS